MKAFEVPKDVDSRIPETEAAEATNSQPVEIVDMFMVSVITTPLFKPVGFQ